MNTSTQKFFGIAALALAVLFPVYWIGGLGFAINDMTFTLRTDLQTLNAWDALFLVIGILEVTVYIGLHRYFRHQINGGAAAILLLIMAALVALFHCSLLVDLTLGLGLLNASNAVLDLMTFTGAVVLGVYALVLGALGIVLFTRFPQLPPLLKAFSVLAFITAIVQITVVLAIVNLVLFPVLMVVVAFHFLLGENSVEVV